jgi:hypothetical protein
MSDKCSGHERRVGLRVSSTQETPCHFATLERIECHWAQVRDLSPLGVGLVLDCFLEPGTDVVVELPSKNASFLHVSARVVRSTAQGNARWLTGCVFVKPLTEDAFQALS